MNSGETVETSSVVGGICTDQQCEKHSTPQEALLYRQLDGATKKKPTKKHHAKANNKNRHSAVTASSVNTSTNTPLHTYGRPPPPPPQFVPHPIATCLCAAHPCCKPPLYDVMMTSQQSNSFVTATNVDGTTYYHRFAPSNSEPPTFIYPPVPPPPQQVTSDSTTPSSLSMTSLSMTSSSRCSSPLSATTAASGGSSTFDHADLRSIVSAAEAIFSEEQLERNVFLKRKLSSSRRGFVSVKLLSQMNSIKKLAKDSDKLLAALRTSTKLELSPDSTKIRIRDSSKSPSCRHSNKPAGSSTFRSTDYASLLLIDLDDVMGRIDVLLSKFSVFGDILQIRIVPSDRPLPTYLRNYSAVVPQLGKVKCATVEFQHFNNAQKACDWSKRNNYTSVLLGPRLKRAITNQQKISSNQHKYNRSRKEMEEDEIFDSSSQQSSSSETLPMCYRLDSGNSLDSGLECCSSSVGSMESDATTSEPSSSSSAVNL